MLRATFPAALSARSRCRAHSGHMTAVDTTEPILLTIPEAARRLSIGRTLTYELIASGQLACVHIGRATRVPATAVQDFVDERLTASQTEAVG